MKPVEYTDRKGLMRIAVDAHVLGRKQTGNETYVRNLLREFALTNSGNEFIAYFSAPGAELHIPETIRTRKVSQNPWLRLGVDLPRAIRRDRPDLLHVQYTSPLRCDVPLIVTVHDVSFLEHPKYFSRFRRKQLRATVARTVRRAARIIAPSEFSRTHIARSYGIPQERINVIHNGVDPRFHPIPREKAARWIIDKHRIPTPYILTVGDLQERKNQTGLIQAFAEMLRERSDLPHRLVLVGKDNWHGHDVREAARRCGVSDRIHFTGFVSDEDLVRFYCACDIFMFPSFYEGFGLPILEAMACGRAVACSDSSAIPEVADAAAVLFDPSSVPKMTRAMLDLLVHADLRTRYERLGQQRAARFSWERAAKETLAVYEGVAHHNKISKAAVKV